MYQECFYNLFWMLICFRVRRSECKAFKVRKRDQSQTEGTRLATSSLSGNEYITSRHLKTNNRCSGTQRRAACCARFKKSNKKSSSDFWFHYSASTKNQRNRLQGRQTPGPCP